MIDANQIIAKAQEAVMKFDKANEEREIWNLGIKGMELETAMKALRSALFDRGCDPYDLPGAG